MKEPFELVVKTLLWIFLLFRVLLSILKKITPVIPGLFFSILSLDRDLADTAHAGKFFRALRLVVVLI